MRLYRLGFVFFTFGSTLCGLSQTGLQLVIFRLIQGGGAALLSANATAIITDTFPPNERGKALGTNQISVAAGSILGLVVGAILTGSLGWRSIFWVNVPIGLLAIAWSQSRLKELGTISKKQRVDLPGNAIFLLGLTILLACVTLYAQQLLDAQLFYLMLLVGGLSLVSFVYTELHVRNPVLAAINARLQSSSGLVYLQARDINRDTKEGAMSSQTAKFTEKWLTNI